MIIANIGMRLVKDESGATAIEYGLIVSLIVIALIGAFNTFANESIGMWKMSPTRSRRRAADKNFETSEIRNFSILAS